MLDILALNPSSVEYYSRNAESLDQLFNMMNRYRARPCLAQARSANVNCRPTAIALLQRLGYTGTALPDLLNHFFLTDNPQITTIIDDRALSETNPDSRLHRRRAQLHSVAHRCGHDSRWIRCAKSRASPITRAPQALLYLFLRHALMLGYYNSSYNFHRNAGFLSAI